MHCTTRQPRLGSWSRAGLRLPWDGDASGGEDVSLPSLMPGQRTLHRPLRKGPTIRTGDITKGLRTAEGWSDRRNAKGPKPAPNPTWTSKATSLSTAPARAGYRKRISVGSQARPSREQLLPAASLPRPRAGDEGVGG